MERIINVFGGNGFVGSRYCDLTPNVIKNDRNDYTAKSDEVVYFISTVDNYNVHTNPYIDIETNLTTLVRTLETCSTNVTFNFISSWFVYGDVPLPAKENSYCSPRGFYSITKRTAEQLLISYCETFGIKYRILRLANVLGKSDNKVSKKKNALQYMINQVVNNENIDLYEGGIFYRDYIHVDDVVQAINLIIEKGAVNEIYNVGNGEKVFIGQALRYIKDKVGSTSKFGTMEIPEFHKVVQTKNMVLDVSKIQSLGYVPKYNLYQMLDTLI